MGTVYVGTSSVGTFTPQVQGASGDVLVDSATIGTFSLYLPSGFAYVDTITVGYYSVPGVSPTLLEDPRFRTKYYLIEKIVPTRITKDDETQASYAVIYAYPNYPLIQEFVAELNAVDVLFLVGTPDSEPLPVGAGYVENVPITICAVDKTGITGTKLRWKAERELRRVVESYTFGSFRVLDRMSDSEERLGSTVLYSVTYTLRYKRYT